MQIWSCWFFSPLRRADYDSRSAAIEYAAALFLGIYTIFLLGLKWLAPGYIEQVWNLRVPGGVIIYGLPLEELLFGFLFGLVWTGIYEHFTWKRSVAG